MTPSRGESDLVGLLEAAKRLGISRNTAYQWVWAGQFPVPAMKVGQLWKVNRVALEGYLALVDPRRGRRRRTG